MASPADRPRPTHVPPFVRTYNRMVRSLAGRRLYALLRHQGRKSGKRYETPVMAWRTRGGMLVPITWGTESDWYRNTMAAGGCEIQLRGRWYHCTAPRLIERAAALSYLAAPMRIVSRAFPVHQFLLLAEVHERG